MARNECKEMGGCFASCCHDARLPRGMSANHRRRIFPHAIQVGLFTDFDTLTKPGVYFKPLGREIRIVGVCPNQDSGECLVHKDPPWDCSHLMRSSDACVDFRRRDKQQ